MPNTTGLTFSVWRPISSAVRTPIPESCQAGRLPPTNCMYNTESASVCRCDKLHGPKCPSARRQIAVILNHEQIKLTIQWLDLNKVSPSGRSAIHFSVISWDTNPRIVTKPAAKGQYDGSQSSKVNVPFVQTSLKITFKGKAMDDGDQQRPFVEVQVDELLLEVIRWPGRRNNRWFGIKFFPPLRRFLL